AAEPDVPRPRPYPARAAAGEHRIRQDRPARRRLCAARSGGRVAARAPGSAGAMTGGADGGPEHGPTVVRLENVGLSYGRTRALDGVSLAIPAGRMVGLIGPDGVGKSSLLSLIAGA